MSHKDSARREQRKEKQKNFFNKQKFQVLNNPYEKYLVQLGIFTRYFTLLYTHFYSRKKHSLLHTKTFSSWFSIVLSVKALIFNPSQRTVLWRLFLPACQWIFGVKACSFNPSQVNLFSKRSTISENSQPKSGKVTFHRQCEGLKDKAFTPKTCENQQKTRFMWRRECFFGEI